MKPIINIIIPCYDMHGKGGEFLEFSLNRIFQQDHRDVIMVTISDQSINDRIKNKVDEWSDRLNICYLKNKGEIKNASANLNYAMKNGNDDSKKCQYIKFLFQDDFLYDHTSIGKTIHRIQETDLKWLVSSCYHSYNGIDVFRYHEPYYNADIYKGVNTISSPSVLTIRTEIDTLFDENLIWLMDCDYYKHLFDLYGNPAILNSATVVNRLWENQVSNSVSDEIKNNELMYTIKKFHSI